jgi:hypothetical protein
VIAAAATVVVAVHLPADFMAAPAATVIVDHLLDDAVQRLKRALHLPVQPPDSVHPPEPWQELPHRLLPE